MVLFRTAMLLLLLGAGVCFAFYAGTAEPRYKRYGLMIFKWTLIAAFVFFAVLFLEQLG
ncbi:MAG TPA: hypothetical protein VN649_01320 [Ramlibacter sp.]|nr:hypothetical protein [Ramlibacter sp.]